MASTIKVKAAPGRVLGDPQHPGKFIGLRRRTEADKGKPVMHRVPHEEEGKDKPPVEFVSAGPVEVPASRFIRKALRRGALLPADAPEGSAPGTSTAPDSGKKSTTKGARAGAGSE